jgi:hypothetical protein
MLNQPVQQPPIGGGAPPQPSPQQEQGQPMLQPPAPVVGCGNYRSYFLDASKDPYNGNYAKMMAEFIVDPAPFTPNQLATRVH